MTSMAALLAACGSNPKVETSGSTAASTSSAAAPSATTAAGPFRTGGTLRVGNQAPAGDLEPLTANDGGTVNAVQTALEYLSFPAADLTLQPRLATAWKAGSSPKEWTFTLRQGVLWQDGTPFGADDVVASFKRYADPKGTTVALSSLTGILSPEGVEKVDDSTVRFTLDRAYADFPTLVSAFNFTVPILPKDYKAGDFKKGGVGTGAYMLKQYVAQQKATYVRNDKYWGGKPHLDGIDLHFYAEAAPIVLAMQSGALDFLPGLAFRDALNLQGKPGLTVYSNPSSSYRPINMRVDVAPFSDVRVRQAIAYGIDRQKLNQTLLKGTGQIGNDHAFAPIFPSSPPAGAVPQREYDPAKAKALLAQAGHGNGLTVTLTTIDFEDIPQLGVLLQDQLKAVGVNVKLNQMTQSAFFGSGKNQPWLSLPMDIVYWASRGAPSQTIAPAYLSTASESSTHWKNKAFDALIAQFDAEVDLQKRHAIGAQAAKIMHDEVPALIPYWLKEWRVIKSGVQGIAPGPNVVFDPSKAGLGT
jgi:peptide/nickel transport system substrate-binding protein